MDAKPESEKLGYEVHCNMCERIQPAKVCTVFEKKEFHCLGCDSHDNKENGL